MQLLTRKREPTSPGEILREEFLAPLAHDNQPQRMLEDGVAFFVKHSNPDQRERFLMHGQVFLASHQQVMPSFQLHVVGMPFARCQGCCLDCIRFTPGSRILQSKAFSVPRWPSRLPFADYRQRLTVEHPITARPNHIHQVLVVLR